MNDETVKKAKVAPSFEIKRSERAKVLMTGQGENPAPQKAQVPEVDKNAERKQKAFKRFMDQHDISDLETLDLKRLNCEIPKQLHVWLHMYSRSGGEYNSMTEIVIDLLSDFAQENGFVFENSKK